MATQLEDRLRRYGETFERAVAVDVRREPTALRPLPFHRRRLVLAFGAAACVILIAAGVALLARTDDEGSSPVAPPGPTPRVPSLGVDQIVWPGPEVGPIDRLTPAAAATGFVRDVLGEDPVDAVAGASPLPIVQTPVDITLANGASFPIMTSEQSDGWAVVGPGDGLGFGLRGNRAELTYDRAVAASRYEVFWRDMAGTHVETFTAPRFPLDVDQRMLSAVLVLRDDRGRPMRIFAAYFGVDIPDDAPTPPSDGPRDPSDVTVVVLNAGQPGGSATNLTNQLRANGYNMLTPSGGPARAGTAVQCREGFEAEANVLLLAAGGSAVIEPYQPPQGDINAQVANCVVYLGGL